MLAGIGRCRYRFNLHLYNSFLDLSDDGLTVSERKAEFLWTDVRCLALHLCDFAYLQPPTSKACLHPHHELHAILQEPLTKRLLSDCGIGALAPPTSKRFPGRRGASEAAGPRRI